MHMQGQIVNRTRVCGLKFQKISPVKYLILINFYKSALNKY